jgi:hypothetical protein
MVRAEFKVPLGLPFLAFYQVLSGPRGVYPDESFREEGSLSNSRLTGALLK